MTDSLLSMLAQAWALSQTAAGAPKRATARQGRRAARGPLSKGLGGMNPTNSADLRVRVPSNLNVPRSIPRNIQSLIAWDTVKINSTITGTSSLVETNFAASLANHPQANSWSALYDQWTIPQFSVEFDSQVPNGSTAIPVALYTALDFDNIANLGSISLLEDFATCEVKVQTAGGRLLRSVRPSTKQSSQVSGGGGSFSQVSGPTWQDAGQQTTLFYGIRSILGASNSCVINVTWTIWFAFRNQI